MISEKLPDFILLFFHETYVITDYIWWTAQGEREGAQTAVRSPWNPNPTIKLQLSTVVVSSLSNLICSVGLSSYSNLAAVDDGIKEPRSICANADMRLLSAGQRSLCSLGLPLALRGRMDPKGHQGKRRTTYMFQGVPLWKSLEPTNHVFPVLPQYPYTQSWQ